MNHLFRAIVALLLVSPAMAGQFLQRAEKQLLTQCKSVGSTPVEFFELTCSTCSAGDRKTIWLSQYGVNHSSSAILIHQTASIGQTQAFPWFGLPAFVAQAGKSIRFFVSRSVSEVPTTITVCGMQLE